MTPLVLIRHGPTAWNAEGRIQGRRDEPLSSAGKAAVETWKLPTDLDDFHWMTSPLTRARMTALLLGHGDSAVEDRLAEMNWGTWEGQNLAELRASLGPKMIAREARGLDFRPPEGESPRDVQLRLRPWLKQVGQSGRPTVAVTHKGVIRAIYALAEGWDMTGKPREKMHNACAHRFVVDAEGRVSTTQMNVPLS